MFDLLMGITEPLWHIFDPFQNEPVRCFGLAVAFAGLAVATHILKSKFQQLWAWPMWANVLIWVGWGINEHISGGYNIRIDLLVIIPATAACNFGFLGLWTIGVARAIVVALGGRDRAT